MEFQSLQPYTRDTQTVSVKTLKFTFIEKYSNDHIVFTPNLCRRVAKSNVITDVYEHSENLFVRFGDKKPYSYLENLTEFEGKEIPNAFLDIHCETLGHIRYNHVTVYDHYPCSTGSVFHVFGSPYKVIENERVYSVKSYLEYETEKLLSEDSSLARFINLDLEDSF